MLFTIKKNKHYSNNFIHKIFTSIHYYPRISYEVTFDESCLYHFNDADDYDVNKLFGFSKGLHHNNSARFGWNTVDGKLHLYAYVYINKVRTICYLKELNINETYKCTILDKNNQFIFIVSSADKLELTRMAFAKTTKQNLGYKLWPYFGGNKVSPHTITIELNQCD